MATDQTGQIQPSGKINLLRANSVETLKAQIRRNKPKDGIGTLCREGDDGTSIDVDLNSLPTIQLDVCIGGVTQTVTVVGRIG